MDIKTIARYEAYKDSGVEWLGEVPEHWEMVRMKFVFRDVSEKNREAEELLSVTQDKGVVPRTWVENRMVMPSGNLSSFKFIEKGDFAISLRSFEGGLEYCHHNGIISPAYTVLKAQRKLQANYYKYLFKSRSFISELQTSIVGIREGKNISYEELCYSLIPIPTKDEQTAIADFLDRKTAQIDQAIAQKERMIELLQERRQILIQQAVTKGLDPNVKMKDSGVEWIGEVPEGWKVKALRFIGNTQNGISKGAEYFGSGFPFVSYGDVYKNYQLPRFVAGLAQSSEEDRRQYSIVKGDVLFTRTSETIEEIGFASTCIETIENSTFAGFLIRFRPTPGILNEHFSKFYFNSKIHRAFFIGEMNLVTRASLSQELLKKVTVLIPSMREQEQIAIHLEDVSRKIETAVQLNRIEISKLREYKSNLIDAAVTGKIKIGE